jgi:DNA helicase-2/ATP-dependent DNA helicase PcrA
LAELLVLILPLIQDFSPTYEISLPIQQMLKQRGIKQDASPLISKAEDVKPVKVTVLKRSRCIFSPTFTLLVMFATESDIKNVRTLITYAKNMMLSAEEIGELDKEGLPFAAIFEKYNAMLKEHRLMDYDDQMVYALSMLRKCPELLRSFQEQFRYVCVDEAQDTSRIQHEIIALLASEQGNLFLVGDEDQSIYGFRAACPEALLRFEKEHPGAKVLFMEENYRSTPEIVQLANRFIARNEKRREKHIQPTRGSGRPVQVIQCKGRRAQYRLLLDMARSCREETAVLFRNNDSALPLIDLLEREGIPYNYRKAEGQFFFTNRVVTDILSILRFAYEPTNPDIFMGIYYKFGAQITKKAAIEAVRRSQRSGKPILQELMRLPEVKSYVKDSIIDLMEHLPCIREDGAETAIRRIWEAMHYRRYVEQKGFDAGKYFILCMLAGGVPSAWAFFDKLEGLKNTIAAHMDSKQNQIYLSTVHSSKGLEYERVYLLDVLDGILPAKGEDELESEEEEQAYEEERRLFYVAMTRARNELYLFDCGVASCFTSEVSASLPAPASDEGDFFHFLSLSQIGKTYTDREWGTGKIVAQSDDRFTVRFWDDRVRSLTIGEMAQRRDKRVTLLQKSPAKQTKRTQPRKGAALERTVDRIALGTAIHHKAFGSGVVRDIRGGIVTVQFQSGETKKFVLRDSVKKGLLYL